jgi:hypothetical protein
MQAARLSTERLLSLTMKVLKMKIYQPGIVRIRREVVRSKRRLPAKPDERLPDFFGQLGDVLGIPRGIMGDLAATGNGCRSMADKAEQCCRQDYLMVRNHSAALRVSSRGTTTSSGRLRPNKA